MIQIYYDESGEYDRSGNLLNMSMAGCAAPSDKWQMFSSAWNAALAAEGLVAFHMTEFEAWKPPFDFLLPDGRRDNDRHNRLLSSLINIMIEHLEGFFGFSSARAVYNGKNAHASAIEDCVMNAVRHAVQDVWWQYERPLHLIFGKQTQFGIGKIEEYRKLYDWGNGRNRITRVRMGEPRELPPLQAADVLAYEMGREQRGRQRRYPFTALLNGAKERNIPMSLKWGMTVRISDRDSLERRE